MAAASPKRRHSPNLSIDLTDLPPLMQPATPSNTLLITNLDDPTIFAPHNIAQIRSTIESQGFSIYAFSPLKSFRRIIAVFHTVAHATQLRQLLDGETLFNHRVRVYFGEHFELSDAEKDKHLQAPKSDKLFFISPPPSPPGDWEMRNEDAPNKTVHADDLAVALNRIDTEIANARDDPLPATPVSGTCTSGVRTRSSTIVFDPADHQCDAGLPAIAVEDTSEGEDEDAVMDGAEDDAGRIVTHTSRPPVELMQN